MHNKLTKILLNSKGVVLTVAILAAIIFYWPIITSGSNLGIQDWDQNFAWNEFTRLSITKYKQFPLWNPYRCGGSVHFANPQINVISLQTILVLIFDTVHGLKLSIIIHSIIGFIGFYILSRQYKISKKGSVLAAIIFSFNGILPSTLSTGMIPFIGIAYAPYVLYFFNKGQSSYKWTFISALFLGLAYYLAFQTAILLSIYIFIFSIFKSIFEKSLRPLFCLIIYTVFFLIIIYPKLVLSLQLFSINPKFVDDFSGYRFDNIFHFLFSKNQGLLAGLGTNTFYFGIDENSLYLGVLPFIAFTAFFVKNKLKIKENLPLLFTTIVILILMLGSTIKPSLYDTLRLIPIFEPFRIAQRFRFDFIILFSLIAGMGMDNLLNFVKTIKVKASFAVFFTLVIFIDLTIFSHKNLLSQTLIIKNKYTENYIQPFVQKISSRDEFIFDYQQYKIPKELENSVFYQPYSMEYPTIVSNVGILNCTDNIGAKTNASDYLSPEYHGEVYTINSFIEPEIEFWSPNKIIVLLKHDGTVLVDDYLIVNQNYYPGWYVVKNNKIEAAVNKGELIATKIDYKVDKVTFVYKPYKWLFENIF